MMNRKMKQLALAVGVAVGSVGLLPSAQAVNVSADNLGQALIFPYYTVRGGWNTLLGVTNTTNQTVAVKVRFREAYNSRDVLDFDVVLSPHDLWNVTVREKADGSGPEISINPDENTCTVGLNAKQVAFPTPPLSYAGGVDRMREGYVEMIMMGAGPAAGLANVPTSCTTLSQVFRTFGTTPADALLRLQAAFPNYPDSPLKGTFSLVNGARGFNAVGLPTALANFRNAPAVTLHAPPTIPVVPTTTATAIAYNDSWHEPSLNAANTAGDYLDAAGALQTSTDTAGAATVSWALSATDVLNEWSRNPTGISAAGASFVTATDWVITFPTKNYYVDTSTNEYAGRATGRTNLPTTIAPFTSAADNAGKSCDVITPSVYNREEVLVDIEYPSPSGRFQICHEVNVLTFNNGAILTSPDNVSIPYPSSFLYGWMNVRFDSPGPLPAIGFAITSRQSIDNLLTEAALYDHSFVRP